MNTHVSGMLRALQKKKRVLFLTTSNRWSGEKGGEKPKSTALALFVASLLPPGVCTVIDISTLNIVPCEGNISTVSGNVCGTKDAALGDATKNPTGHHRCWASINNPEDELWKVSRALLESEAVIFFGSVRWGQMNSIYQKLIERLTWLENRHSTLGEANVLSAIQAGIVAIGHNWRGADIVRVQRKVLAYFGFKTPRSLSWHWQFTTPENESADGYTEAFQAFSRDVLGS